jgi:hypothetical protein
LRALEDRPDHVAERQKIVRHLLQDSFIAECGGFLHG